MLLQYFSTREFMKKYLCWSAHREPYVLYEIIVERMVGPISSCSNMHEVVDDNSNPYKSMIIDAMRMNQGYAGENPIVDEESNVDVVSFFDVLKDFNEPS
jgi:hypothetical protein